MAHELIMPIPQFTSSASAYPAYHNPTQPVSPLPSNTPTPHNASPTSPRTPHHHPPPLSVIHTSLRPPKSPLYIPAVLRPTDPPRRAAPPQSPRHYHHPQQQHQQKPPTPPQSMHSSFENLDHALKGLSWRATMPVDGSGKIGLGLGLGDILEGSVEGLGKVTGTPTRDHWKPDSSTPICDDPTCTRTFTYLTRRHHCRRCGSIFCAPHARFSIPLDQDANYHPAGARCRACEGCWVNFRRWVGGRMAAEGEHRAGSMGGGAGAGVEAGGSSKVVTCKGKARGGSMAGRFGSGGGGGGPAGGGKNAEGAGGASVPRDWNWSTF